MLAGVAGLAGCLGPAIVDDDAADTTGDGDTGPTTFGTGSSSSSSGSTTTEPDPSTTLTGTTVAPDTGEGEAGTWDEGCGFLCVPDGGTEPFECDPWAQDCPVGEKCMPWANDGGSSWNATRCSPVDASPNQIGDPCHVEGSGVSGIDDCALGAMCFDVDPETNTGTCYEMCHGSEANPQCFDPSSTCIFGGDGVLILCYPMCNPLDFDCGEGRGCYPGWDTFICSYDASGDAGAFGDACDYTNDCDAGLFCGEPEQLPECAGTNCCNAFCDLGLADPDATCPGFADGQTCLPYYEDGQAPSGLETLGYCSS